MTGEMIMPTLEEFKEKQKIVGAKKNKQNFKPKRYAPYLLQEEIINYARLQKSNEDITQGIEPEFGVLHGTSNTENTKQKIADENKIIEDKISEEISNPDHMAVDAETIARLCGIRKKLMFFLVDLCETRGKLDTGPITAETLIEASGSTYKTIKKVLQTMIEDGLIKRMKGKRGKGGFSVFLLPKEIMTAVLKHKRLVISESVNTNKNILPAEKTNFVKNHLNNLPEEWKKIDYE